MTNKILFVDDEPAVLDGYKRTLHREFEVESALGPTQALDAFQNGGPYAVVVSDMRMPGMSGSELLSQVRKRWPDTVRMLLTGYTDIGPAIEAVNQGNIFRFLTKPCQKEVLVQAIEAGLEQYRLLTIEKALLEETLLGSIKVLADVLSAASPEAFGRSVKIADYVRHMTAKLNVESPWRFEAAATLSQLGCVTLDSELIQRAFAGVKLSAEDQTRFNAHPKSAMDLLLPIPRLESVSWMIGQQFNPEVPYFVPGGADPGDILLGARMLKLAVAYEQMRTTVSSREDLLMHLRARRTEFEPELINALADFQQAGEQAKRLQKIPVARITMGMILDEDIKNAQGVLMVAKGYEVTSALAMKLENFSRAGLIPKEIMVFA